MPAPTAPEVTTTTSRPAFRCAAICVTSCSSCAGSGCLRLSVSTPVPSLTTRREMFLSNSERTGGKLKEKLQIPSSKLQEKSKSQATHLYHAQGLKFGASLRLGTWSLKLRHVAIAIRNFSSQPGTAFHGSSLASYSSAT